ncbi:hypothetical protein J8273_6479 [Carpediemonas membranifera]|uniref:Uncharacterized protein n=1 Tax=Carpediemonas membranifera TaxID=201153 RepID=A0A8J6E057_9EUKA|nr:hypothetical protein J8273_6479 [Carpediemonas membranifera]|eukprot:KAG9391703.1 hypothetical protein J8273_6479 [Carpediemonas membranifera]
MGTKESISSISKSSVDAISLAQSSSFPTRDESDEFSCDFSELPSIRELSIHELHTLTRSTHQPTLTAECFSMLSENDSPSMIELESTMVDASLYEIPEDAFSDNSERLSFHPADEEDNYDVYDSDSSSTLPSIGPIEIPRLTLNDVQYNCSSASTVSMAPRKREGFISRFIRAIANVFALAIFRIIDFVALRPGFDSVLSQ